MKNVIKTAVLALLVLSILLASLFAIKLWEKHRGRYNASQPTEAAVIYNDKEYVLKENIETFLVIGLDKFDEAITSDSYNNNQQADFLMLFVLDNDSKKCTALHINRDTMASINVLGVAGQKIDTVTKQIALAHTYGNGKKVSCRNTLDAVSKLLLGVKMDHYISLTMDSVEVLNDLVDGVEVTVLDDFTGIDDTLKKGEKVILKGEHVLNYVRTRYGLEDSSNSTRMKRQQQYVNCLYSEIKSHAQNDPEFIIESVTKLADYVVSDRSVSQLKDIAKKLSEYKFTIAEDIKGENKIGEEFVEFYADAYSVEKTVIELFYTPKD